MDQKRVNYITLKDASALCGYSPDYLNLIARKGYLKAVKIGRNWATKKEWLQDYICRIEKKHGHAVEALTSVATEAKTILPVPKSESFSELSAPAPAVDSEVLNFLMAEPPRPDSGLRIGGFASFVCLTLVAVVAFAVIFFSQRDVLAVGMKISYEAAARYYNAPIVRDYVAPKSMTASLEEALEGAGRFLAPAANNFFSWIKNAGSKLADFVNYVFFGKTEVTEVTETKTESAAGGVIDKTVLEKSTDALEKDIVSDTEERIDGFRAEFGLSGNGESGAAGMVVAPVTGSETDDEKLKDQIKKNFSDEVTVETSDENSGVVVPQFRDGPGDEYIYMLVPVSNDQ